MLFIHLSPPLNHGNHFHFFTMPLLSSPICCHHHHPHLAHPHHLLLIIVPHHPLVILVLLMVLVLVSHQVLQLLQSLPLLLRRPWPPHDPRLNLLPFRPLLRPLPHPLLPASVHPLLPPRMLPSSLISYQLRSSILPIRQITLLLHQPLLMLRFSLTN